MVKKRETNDMVTVEEGALIEVQEVQEEENSLVENEETEYENLLNAVQEIRKNTALVGYILKGNSKASVDLNDSTKIIEFAMLSSQAFEAAKSLSSTFNMGDNENILIEGKNLKVLCLELEQNKLSIFMEKNADHKSILRLLAPRQE